MLVKEVVQSFNNRVELSIEYWGQSSLAELNNIKMYPAVFINGKVFARPKDFGFMGLKGLYTPWNNPKSQLRFQQDLKIAIEKELKKNKVSY